MSITKLIKEHKAVETDFLPSCDVCTEPAYADCNLPLYGSWGNVCKNHFKQFGCQLGLGKGQELIWVEAE